MRGGFPHSETPGSKPARGSPGLVAACRVLHRLSAPRHPPGALLSLAPPRRPRRRGRAPRPLTMPTNDKNTNERARDASPRRADGRSDSSRTLLHTRRARHKGARARRLAAARCKRTSPALRGPPPRRLVGPGRLERPTSRLSGARSNRLSYGPGPAGARAVLRRHARRLGTGEPSVVSGEGTRGRRARRPGAPRPRPPAAVASMVDRPPRLGGAAAPERR